MKRLLSFSSLLHGLLMLSCASNDPSESISPTGTYLEPHNGLGEEGYAVLDEVCEGIDNSHYIDRYVTPMFRDSAIVGDVAYLVDGSLLWAIDISRPHKPTRLSMTRLEGTPISIAATDNGLLAIANGTDGLYLIDGNHPEAPPVLNVVPIPMPLDVAVHKTHALVASGSDGLIYIDISTPEDAVVIADSYIPGFANAVTTDGTTAFVAACDTVSIIDIQDPNTLETISRIDIPEGHARELTVADDILLVAGGEALFSIEISDLENPNLIGFYTDRQAEGFYVNAVVAKDNVAYIAAGDESFRAIQIMGMSDIADYSSDSTNFSVELEGVVELEPPGTLSIVTGDPIGINLHDNLLLVLGNFRWVGERLLRIVDVSNPNQIEDVGAYTQPLNMYGVETVNQETVVYFNDGTGAMLDDTGNISESFELPSPIVKTITKETTLLLLENGRVYQTDHYKKFISVAKNASDLAIADNLAAYASPFDNSIYPIDFDLDPQYFSLDGITQTDAFLGFSRLVGSGNRIYAYDWALGKLHIIGTRNKKDLEYIGFVYIGQCEAYDVADTYLGTKSDRARLTEIDGGLMMLCPQDENGRASLRFIALDNPDMPEVVETWELPEGRYFDFQIDNNAVYTVGFDNNRYTSTLLRIDSDLFDEVVFDGRAMGLSIVDGTITVADADFGVRRFIYADGILAPVVEQ